MHIGARTASASPSAPALLGRRLALAAADAILGCIAFAAAYLLAFDVVDPQFSIYVQQVLPLLPVVILIRGCMGIIWGVDPPAPAMLLPAARGTALRLLSAVAVGSALLATVGHSLWMLPTAYPVPRDAAGVALRIPWRIICIDAVLAVILMGALRTVDRQRLRRLARLGRRPVLVAGHEPMLSLAVGQLAASSPSPARQSWCPVAVMFWADEAATPHPQAAHTQASSWHGIPASAGGAPDLRRIVEFHRVGDVLLTFRDADPERLRTILAAFDDPQHPASPPRFHLMPDVASLLGDRSNAPQLPSTPAAAQLPSGTPRIRAVEFADLLRRPSAAPELPEVRSQLEGRTVLITGAGGSIGSELARRLIQHRPARLVLVGRGEHALFELECELQQQPGAGDVERSLRVVDIREAHAIGRVLHEYPPHVVFHAAANKHVPMMEQQPWAALLNNTLGTARLLQATRAAGVERLLLISTDKAVRPVSAMGISKRLAERVLWHEAHTTPPGRVLTAVRFGNVLGSRGSVAVILRRQIEAGGPVTITDPDMTRYFMSAGEAATLVLSAAALGHPGQLYLLDMGPPLRLGQLVRDMIRLHGRNPHEIPVVVTGPRPGERMHEEPLDDGLETQPTAHPSIRTMPHERVSHDGVEEMLRDLEDLEAGRWPTDALTPEALRQRLQHYLQITAE